MDNVQDVTLVYNSEIKPKVVIIYHILIHYRFHHCSRHTRHCRI